jgi:hypothetical protein
MSSREEKRRRYDRTAIDWIRLAKFAQRVAREFTVPRPPQQILEQFGVEKVVRRGILGLRKRTVVETSFRKKTVDSDWVLAHRYWRKRTSYRSGGLVEETECNDIEYCLRTNGKLVVYVTSWEELVQREGGFMRVGEERHEREFTESDVILFDLESRHYESRNNNPHVWTDGDPGKKLPVHAKSVGLSLTLKQLLV